MDEMGLAAGMAQQQVRPMQDIKQIVQMLMQGMTPEELVAQGVPEELVMAALDVLSKQMTQVPPEQAGLAATMVRPEQGM